MVNDCGRAPGVGLGIVRDMPNLPGTSVLCWSPSAKGIMTARLIVPMALAMPPSPAMYVQLPSMAVPQGFSVTIKALPVPLNPLGSLIFIGESIGILQSGQSYPLVPNEPIPFQIDDVNDIWIAASVAGCGVAIACERM
ncbi:MAG: hypothetical protein PHQ43_07880 [Dehalococcoidales bacterium]|nr:hypothetical protein [Dehalococcoidales bacterium]